MLLGHFCLTLFGTAYRRIHKKNVSKQFSIGKRFFYRPLHLAFFPKSESEEFIFSIICTQNFVRFAYAACVVLLVEKFVVLLHGRSFSEAFYADPLVFFWVSLTILCFILASFLIGEYIPRVIGAQSPEKSMRTGAPIASIFLILCFPLTYLFLSILKTMSRTVYFEHLHEPATQAKQEIIDILQEINFKESLDKQDKKLISSVFKFRELIAREVMVPRVDVFGVAADATIKEASAGLHGEGYSRIPVYRNNLDDIIGVLMYKDVLQKYVEYANNGNDPKILDAPVESIMKSPLYTPETKKISNLLQEFRKKQVHIAIVVDEYGGTEGIVTIEDILEQIVGEIEDEYDDSEEAFYTQTEGGWIVDARMSVLDAEEQLGIHIPQEGDYDTIGGYIFHCAGTIPSRGFVIHHDEFELIVLRSNERCVEKVRIKPTFPSTVEEGNNEDEI